jgi:hypothetical protein
MRLKKIIKWFLYSFIGSEIVAGFHMYFESIGYSISKWTLKMLSHFIGVPWYLGVIIGAIGLIALHFWDRYQEKKVDRKQAQILDLSEQINELKNLSQETLDIHRKNDPRVEKSYEILQDQFCEYIIHLKKILPYFEKECITHSYIEFLKNNSNDVVSVKDWETCSKEHSTLAFLTTNIVVCKMEIALSCLNPFFKQENINILREVLVILKTKMEQCNSIIRKNINNKFQGFLDLLFEEFNQSDMVNILNKIIEVSSDEFRHTPFMVYKLSDKLIGKNTLFQH